MGSNESDSLRDEVRRIRVILEGERGDNGIVSRVVALEFAQSVDDRERDSRRKDRRDFTRGVLLVAAGSAIGQALEYLWRLGS